MGGRGGHRKRAQSCCVAGSCHPCSVAPLERASVYTQGMVLIGRVHVTGIPNWSPRPGDKSQARVSLPAGGPEARNIVADTLPVMERERGHSPKEGVCDRQKTNVYHATCPCYMLSVVVILFARVCVHFTHPTWTFWGQGNVSYISPEFTLGSDT